MVITDLDAACLMLFQHKVSFSPWPIQEQQTGHNDWVVRFRVMFFFVLFHAPSRKVYSSLFGDVSVFRRDLGTGHSGRVLRPRSLTRARAPCRRDGLDWWSAPFLLLLAFTKRRSTSAERPKIVFDSCLIAFGEKERSMANGCCCWPVVTIGSRINKGINK